MNDYLEEIDLSWNKIRQRGAFAIGKSLRVFFFYIFVFVCFVFDSEIIKDYSYRGSGLVSI